MCMYMYMYKSWEEREASEIFPYQFEFNLVAILGIWDHSASDAGGPYSREKQDLPALHVPTC